MDGNTMIEKCGIPVIDLHLLPSSNWQNGGTGDLPNCGTWNQLPNGPLRRSCDNTGPTGSSAIWPLMHRKSQRWQQWWEMGMTMRSSFTSWGMPVLAPLDNGALPLKSSRNTGAFRSRGQKNQSVPSLATFIRKSVLQITSSRHGIPWSGSVPSFRFWMSQPPNVLHQRRSGYRRLWSPQQPHRSERQWSQPRRSSLHWNRGRLPVALTLGGRAKWPGRPLMHSFWEWSDSKWGVVPASMIFNTRVQAQWRSHPTRLRWWPGRQKLPQLSASKRIQSLWLPQSFPSPGWTGGLNGVRLWFCFPPWNAFGTWTTWFPLWARIFKGSYPVLAQATGAWGGLKRHLYAKECIKI